MGKRKASKISGCKLEHHVDMNFNFHAGACQTFTDPDPKVLLCFDQTNHRQCHTFDGNFFQSAGSSTYSHLWTHGMANYHGKALTTGCYQSKGFPSCSLKTELMDLQSSIWVSGPDYSLTSA